MIRKLLALALVLAATPAFAKHPRNLTPIADGPEYTLAEDFVASEKAATFTLKAGKYVAAFEDADALYLIGGDDCLEMHVVPPKQPDRAYTQTFNCGVYYPKAGAGQALFFVIRAGQARNREFGWLINAIIQSGTGSFDYPISKKQVVDLRPRFRSGEAALIPPR